MQFQIYVNASFHISKSNTTNKTGLIIKIGVNISENNLSTMTILTTGKLLMNVKRYYFFTHCSINFQVSAE